MWLGLKERGQWHSHSSGQDAGGQRRAGTRDTQRSRGRSNSEERPKPEISFSNTWRTTGTPSHPSGPHYCPVRQTPSFSPSDEEGSQHVRSPLAPRRPLPILLGAPEEERMDLWPQWFLQSTRAWASEHLVLFQVKPHGHCGWQAHGENRRHSFHIPGLQHF